MFEKRGVIAKRGLSTIITTVLIILLVLVAIAIIWAAVRPTIETAGGRIGADCLTVKAGAKRRGQKTRKREKLERQGRISQKNLP